MNCDIERFKKWMAQKRLNSNTIETYSQVSIQFLRYLNLKEYKVLDAKLLEAFNYECVVLPQYSINYQNQCISGIKKYFTYKNITVEALNIERPKRSKNLPQVLSLEEVRLIIEHTHNLKHKTLLSLIYSAGLRIREATSLKLSDIDSERMLIHVKMARVKKTAIRYFLLLF